MRKLNNFLAIITLLVVASCGGNDKGLDKKALLEKLKQEQAALSEKIAKLESEISAADTNKVVKKALVSVSALAKENFSHYLDIQGNVVSDNNILVSALMPGKLIKVYVQQGDVVSKGQLLAQIDPDQIQKGIAELKTGLELATTVYEKQKALWDEKIGTEIQFLQAKNNKESLEKKLASMYTQLDYTNIKATQSGVIDQVIYKEGESVQPGPAFRIVNNNGGLKVTAEIAETYSDKVNKGDEIEINFQDIDKVLNARITSVGEIINPMSRTFAIESRLIGNPGGVKPNMIVRIKVRDYFNKNAFVVPVNTVQTGLEGQFVYVVQGGKATRKSVKVGKTYGTKAEILDGLSEGDQLITTGYQDLVNGQDVTF